jgi:3-hydroxyisobutyrate dehydrogenase
MIGILGLGNMGYAIAERLISEGETLIVWNRSSDKANGLQGVSIAATPEDVVQSAEVIISILANDSATQAVYFGDHGILSAALKGKLVIEMCTMAPARSIELAAAVIDKQGMFLECPVGGTIGPALEGKLLGLAGGTDEAFSLAKPVLQKLTRRLEHFGPVGSGAAMKLSINLPLMVYWCALGEALQIALSHNVDPALALDVLSDSSGAIGAARKRVPPICDMVVNGEHGNANFTLENAIKDIELMVAEAQSNGEPAKIVSSALERYRKAEQQGFTAFDCSLVAALNNQR